MSAIAFSAPTAVAVVLAFFAVGLIATSLKPSSGRPEGSRERATDELEPAEVVASPEQWS